MMIRSLFLPDRIGSYYLFSQKIVGIELNKTMVSASVIRASGKKRVIEQIIQKNIESSAITPYAERASKAIALALEEIGSYHELHTALPSSLVIFKDITVPFTSTKKIAQVLPFEVESMLPFGLDQAAMDYIITKKDLKSGQSELIVAAIKQEQLQEHIALFTAAGAHPTKIIVDMFALYDLYLQQSELKNLPDTTALIDLGLHHYKIALISDGVLKAVRMLPKGLSQCAKILADENKKEVIEVLDSLVKTGIADQANSLAQCLADIPFTIEATLQKNPDMPKLHTTVITGLATDVAGFDTVISSLTGTPCIAWHTRHILHNSTITAKPQLNLPATAITSLATALVSNVAENFNLEKTIQISQAQKTFRWQLLISIVLVTALFGLLVMKTISNSSTLNKEIFSAEDEAIQRLKKEFPALKKRPGLASLELANKYAQNELQKEKDIWFALSPQNRSSFLTDLQELSTRIDRDGLGLNLKRLVLNGDNLTLEGEVRDFNALRLLEEELQRSAYFKNVPRLQEPKFVIRLTLDKTYKEGS